MKGHSNTYLSLNDIVDTALLDLQESAHRKEQFLSWALDYYKRYRMDMAKEIRTVKLSMTPWKSIMLPDDCVDWIALGIPNGQMLMTFVNDNTITPRDCACDTDSPQQPTFDNVDVAGEGFPFYNCTEFGEDPGKLFGLLVKNNGVGYFHPNYNERVNEIQLSVQVKEGTKILLMYLSTLFNPNVSSVVHPYFEFVIRYGIHYENMKYKRRSGNKNISLGEIAAAKDELDEEICKAVERSSDLRTEDIISITREAILLAPKQ